MLSKKCLKELKHDQSMYGSLLSKSGISLAPDGKLLLFLSILRDQLKVHEKTKDYAMMAMIRNLIKTFHDHEERRLLHNMRVSQLEDLAQVEREHRETVQQFNQQWDLHLNDYDKSAE